MSNGSDGTKRALPPTMHSPLLAAALALLMTACAMEVAGEDEPGLDESEIILHNKLRTEEIVLNSLTGSAAAISALVANPLTSDTFAPGGPLAHKLNDPNARAFLKYLAECALPAEPAYAISYTDFKGKKYSFAGRHGLCDNEWAVGAPSDDCKELVTACILTRNNAKGVEVWISTRGKDLDDLPFPLEPAVPVKTTALSGSTIASFKTCSSAQDGPARDCGFTAKGSLVGVCTPGEKVTLGCTAGSRELATRICDGPNGCNHDSPLNLHEDSLCGQLAQTTTFVCGADRAFAAMIGPLASKDILDGGFSGAAGGIYPAGEDLVFPYEEGSFYGSLFEPGGHASGVFRDVDASGNLTTSFPNGATIDVFTNASACHDPSWSDADAYLTNRLCAVDVTVGAQTATLCAAQTVGACVGGLAPACATGDAPPVGDGDNDQCKDIDKVVHEFPLTTRLHEPCDLIPPGLEASCQRRDASPRL